MLSYFITKIVSMSLMSACAILATIVFKKLLSHKLSPKAHLYVWLPVILHLIIPHSFSSKMSIYNFVPKPDISMTKFSAESISGFNSSITEASSPQFHFNALFMIWITGAIISFLIPVISYYKFKSKLVSSNRNISEARTISKKCASVLEIKTVPSLFVCENNVSPMILGVFRPQLIIPSFIFESFTPAQINVIFTHEYIHLKRNDRFINILLMAICTFHWFNPLVRIMCRYIRQDMENVCDEETMAMLDTGCRTIYGETIVDLLEKSSVHFVNSMSSTMAYTVKTLKSRIINLCNFGKKRLRIIALPTAVIISTTFLTGAVAKKADDTAELISESITDITNEIIPSIQTNIPVSNTDITAVNPTTSNVSENSDSSNEQGLTTTPAENLSSGTDNRIGENQNSESIPSHPNDSFGEYSDARSEQQSSVSPVNTSNDTSPVKSENTSNPTDNTNLDISSPKTENNGETSANNQNAVSSDNPAGNNTPSKTHTYSSDESTSVFSSDKDKSGFVADNGHIKIETVGLISSSDSNMSGYFNVYRDGELVGESVRANISASPNSINFNQTVGSEHDYSFSVDSKSIDNN